MATRLPFDRHIKYGWQCSDMPYRCGSRAHNRVRLPTYTLPKQCDTFTSPYDRQFTRLFPANPGCGRDGDVSGCVLRSCSDLAHCRALQVFKFFDQRSLRSACTRTVVGLGRRIRRTNDACLSRVLRRGLDNDHIYCTDAKTVSSLGVSLIRVQDASRAGRRTDHAHASQPGCLDGRHCRLPCSASMNRVHI